MVGERKAHQSESIATCGEAIVRLGEDGFPRGNNKPKQLSYIRTKLRLEELNKREYRIQKLIFFLPKNKVLK